METIAVILFVMKANHSIMELGKYDTMEECMKALPVAEKMFKEDDHVMCGDPKEHHKHSHGDHSGHGGSHGN